MWDESDPEERDEEEGRRPRDPSRIDLPLREDGPSRRKRADVAPLFPDWKPAQRSRSSLPSILPAAEPPDRPALSTSEQPEPRPYRSVEAPATGVRLTAGLVDLAVLALLLGILTLTLRLLTDRPPSPSSLLFTCLFCLELGLVGAALGLFFFGRTPGLAVVAATVVEPSGSPVRFGRAVLRTLCSLLGLVLPGLPLLVAALRQDRRSTTDLLSGTRLRSEG